VVLARDEVIDSGSQIGAGGEENLFAGSEPGSGLAGLCIHGDQTAVQCGFVNYPVAGRVRAAIGIDPGCQPTARKVVSVITEPGIESPLLLPGFGSSAMMRLKEVAMQRVPSTIKRACLEGTSRTRNTAWPASGKLWCRPGPLFLRCFLRLGRYILRFRSGMILVVARQSFGRVK
jgi:hypothetical protein